jgi:hypothetical protein
VKYKEHYPNFTHPLDTSDEAQGDMALCGQPAGIVLNMWRDNDLDEEVICVKCRKKACPDCLGTGILGANQVGLYCPCDYGSVRELSEGFYPLGE